MRNFINVPRVTCALNILASAECIALFTIFSCNKIRLELIIMQSYADSSKKRDYAMHKKWVLLGRFNFATSKIVVECTWDLLKEKVSAKIIYLDLAMKPMLHFLLNPIVASNAITFVVFISSLQNQDF